ncbi:MAG TPA: lysylphosphatidylglycerol synthase domain-containing protein [Candidatus Saccharimonadaceae bacterium]|nr:lysylphosphatidylglycerol synthase domain-containing protein [Candidatus Saccharimonadaceae bacterium]
MIVVVLALWFFYSALSKNLSSLETISFSITPLVIVAIIMFILAVVSSGLIWGSLLGKLIQKSIGYSEAVSVHVTSWLLKYIPGQAGSYLSKVVWGGDRGVSKKSISVSFIYENTLTVMASVLLSIPVIFIFSSELGSNLTTLIPLLAAAPLLIIFIRPLFHRMLNFLSKILKRKELQQSDFLSPRDLVVFQGAYLIPRVINGLAFLLIAISLLSVEPYMYVAIASSYILASIVGLLAFFVPSGIGVREAVIVLTLSTYFGVEQAIVLAVVARLYTTIADGLLFLVYIVIKSRQRRLNDR